jgi:hypothetical protein
MIDPSVVPTLCCWYIGMQGVNETAAFTPTSCISSKRWVPHSSRLLA